MIYLSKAIKNAGYLKEGRRGQPTLPVYQVLSAPARVLCRHGTTADTGNSMGLV